MDSQNPKSHQDHIAPGMPPPTPSAPPVPPDDDDSAPIEMTPSQWLRANAITIIILAVGLVLLYRWVGGMEGMWSVAKMVIGLSFVIFIHELGHFAVAKWCDVHVVTFSIGFGPAIPGCKFKWGETTYLLGLVPLGGYVQMVGQVDGDESEDEEARDDPRSYKNKTVWQRMAIISAGVLMNVLLALVCFIIVYTIPGRNRASAVMSEIDSGSPAYVKGLRTGDVIDQIGSAKDPYFEDLQLAVLFSWGDSLKLAYHQPGEKEVRYHDCAAHG